MSKDDLEWLHRFINCAVFGPPASECQRAHRIVEDLAARPEERSLTVCHTTCPKHGGTGWSFLDYSQFDKIVCDRCEAERSSMNKEP